MGTSFKTSRAYTGALSVPDPAAGHRQPTPLLETPGPSQASLGQSLLGSLLLSPGSQCVQGNLCTSRESWIKDLLSKAPPIRTRPSFPLSQSLPSGSFHKLLILILDMTLTLKSLSCVRLFAAPWTVAYQAPPSMEFSRQEYWSGLPFPSPGYLSDPGIEPGSSTLQADTLPSEPSGKSLSLRGPTLQKP